MKKEFTSEGNSIPGRLRRGSKGMKDNEQDNDTD